MDKRARGGRAFRNPYLLMGFQLVLWGSYTAVGKLVLGNLPVWPFQCYSFGIALVALAVPYFMRGGLGRLRALGARRLLCLSAMALPSFLYYFLYATALSLTGAVEASVLNYTFPVFVLLLAWPVCGEKPSARGVLAVLLGLAGAAVVLTGGGGAAQSGLNTGALCALAGAVCWGLFSNLGRRAPADAETANLVYMAVGFALSLAGMLAFSAPCAVSAQDALCLVWNGVFNLAAGYWVWFRILSVASAALAANLSFVTPFANLLFIAVLLHEPIRWQHWAGLGIILLGVALQALPVKKPQRTKGG